MQISFHIHVSIYNDIKIIAPNSNLGCSTIAPAERVVDVGVAVSSVIGGGEAAPVVVSPPRPNVVKGVVAVKVNVGAGAGAVAGPGAGATGLAGAGPGAGAGAGDTTTPIGQH